MQRLNDSLMIRAEPDNLTVGEFITGGSVANGNRRQFRFTNVYINERNNISVLDYSNKKLKDPTEFTKNSTTLEASACQLKLPEVRMIIVRILIFPPLFVFKCNFMELCPQDSSGFYNIDNEEYEAMPVEVRLLPRKLRFFISAERRQQLLSQPQ